jgi:capsular polysaccharide biosynthesis protein
MELRNYWHVIWKRRWLVLAIVGLTAIFSAITAFTARPTYQAEVRFIARQDPSPDNSRYLVFTFDRYYNWYSSEFLVDDYTQIVESDAFAKSVLGLMEQTLTLGKDSGTMTMNDVKSALKADRRHRELHVTVTASSRDEAREMAKAVAKVLGDNLMKPISGQTVDDKSRFAQIDEATDDEIRSSRSQEIISALVRIAIGVAAALALVFLLEYLDSSVRDERDAQRVLDMPVLGTIPRA